MKILIISDAWKPQINGVVRTYEFIGAELEQMGHEIKVIGPSDFPICLPCPGYKEIKLALFPYSKLKKMIGNYAPDHIHIATEAFLGKAARRYCKRNSKVFTSSYHTHFPDYIAKRVAKAFPFLQTIVRNTFIKALRKFHNDSTAIMVATPSLENDLKSWGFKAPMKRLTRGVDFETFHTDHHIPNLYSDLKKPIAAYVGRIAIEKNLEDFLKMDWNGSKIIIGDGPSLTALKDKYPNALFTGKKTGQDLGAHLSGADIFVFPSRTDTFGMVIIEALASGLPVAAYNVTGPKDIITEDFLGALHEDNLADASLKALQQKPHHIKRHQHVKENYTWERAAQQFLSIITEAESGNTKRND